MEEELKCPVCRRLYSNPVSLVCGHAVCLVCARIIQTLGQDLDPGPGPGPGNHVQAVGGGGGDLPEGHDDNPDPSSSVGPGLVPDQEVDATSIASETDSGVVCRSRPGSYLGTPCGAGANPLLPRVGGAGSGGGGGTGGGPEGQDRTAQQPVIVCSVCRRPTFLDDQRGGPNALPVARILESLAERFRESRRLPAPCQTCVEIREARVFCEDCKVLYCADCFDAAHSSSSSAGPVHRSRAASAAAKEDRGPPKCPDHDGGDLRLYCCSCKTLVCPSCQLTSRHEGHAVQNVQAVYKTQKCELSQLLHTLSDKVRSTTELIHRLRLMQDHIQVNFEDFEMLVASQCDALIEALQKRKGQLLQDVARERARKEIQFKERISGCASRIQKTTGLLQFSIEVLKDSDPAAYLQMSSSLIDRVVDVSTSLDRSLDDDGTLSAGVDLSLAAAGTESVAGAVESLALAPVKEPNAPRIVTESCRSENNSVTVVWSPAHDGSTPTGYVLELDDGSKGSFREVYCGTQTVCMVEGLLFGRQYMARVMAFNKAGTSQPSPCVCLQTSYVAWFTFDPSTSHPDVLFSNDNLTATSCSFDDRVVLGSVGLSSGVHYWELTVDRFDNNKDPAFGVALLDISKDKMLGRDSSGWSMYIDTTRSWFMHSGTHFDRTEGGVAVGSSVGVLLDLDRQNLSFYVDGEPHGGVVKTGRYGATFYPAVSLNRNVQVTLTSALEVPVDTDNEDD